MRPTLSVHTPQCLFSFLVAARAYLEFLFHTAFKLSRFFNLNLWPWSNRYRSRATARAGGSAGGGQAEAGRDVQAQATTCTRIEQFKSFYESKHNRVISPAGQQNGVADTPHRGTLANSESYCCCCCGGCCAADEPRFTCGYLRCCCCCVFSSLLPWPWLVAGRL